MSQAWTNNETILWNKSWSSKIITIIKSFNYKKFSKRRKWGIPKVCNWCVPDLWGLWEDFLKEVTCAFSSEGWAVTNQVKRSVMNILDREWHGSRPWSGKEWDKFKALEYNRRMWMKGGKETEMCEMMLEARG